ncbi:MAG: methionine synthase, partial [Elusimicrobia bacterium]|nr:methionine synthase [Elusimicrobiota bacterium]
MAKKSSGSTGREKLAGLGVQLPLFPSMAANSLPKSADLSEMRYRVARGVQQAQELERKEKLATEVWIRQQERLGLDVLVEGEMARGDMVSHFARKIEGFAPGGIVRVYGNRYYRRPVVRSKVEWRVPLVADHWKQNQRMSHRVLKAVLTGPYTLAEWSFNEHYPSREALVRDLAVVLKREMTALSDAGAKVVQIDEPALSSRASEFSLVADALREVVAGTRCYVILHHAYGDLSPLWEKMQSLPVDQFCLEAANSNFEFLKLLKKTPTTKDLGIGVVDSHSRVIETPAVIRERIKLAAAAIPAGQLWFSTDSGLRTRTADEAIGKLKALAEG